MEPEPHLALAGALQSPPDEWRPQGVPTEPLQPIALAGAYHQRGVQIESVGVRVAWPQHRWRDVFRRIAAPAGARARPPSRTNALQENPRARQNREEPDALWIRPQAQHVLIAGRPKLVIVWNDQDFAVGLRFELTVRVDDPIQREAARDDRGQPSLRGKRQRL